MRLRDIIKKKEGEGKKVEKLVFSTGECEDCENGDWQENHFEKVGDKVCQYYACVNTEGCNLVSTATLTIDYNRVKV